jgi:translin
MTGAKNPTTANLDEIAEKVRGHLDSVNAVREQALKVSREVIRASANAIRAVHRGEFEEAKALMAEGDRKRLESVEMLAEFPNIYYTGYVQDAAKEFAEASITYAMVRGEPLPDPDDLKVEGPAYLNGLAEAVGEMRRHALDVIREGDIDAGERILRIMDDVYYVLITFDYPDAVTSGLRRTTDMVRGVLERTRGDLTLTIRERQLESAIKDAMAAWEERK